MRVAIMALKALMALFGQDKIWEAVNQIVERRTKIKLDKHEERAGVREAKAERREEAVKDRGKKRDERRDNRQKRRNDRRSDGQGDGEPVE